MSELQAPHLALGVDIGATSIKAATVSLNGELVQRFHQPSPRSLQDLQEFIRATHEQLREPICGIGIGCRGLIDAPSTRINRIPSDL